jgi:sporulation protein YpjB
MKIRKILMLCVFICVIVTPTISAAAPDFQQVAENWSQQATQIANWVEAKNISAAKSQLSELAEQFSKADLAGKDLEVAEIQLLSSAILHLERQLNRVTPDETKMLDAAKRLQIAFDALSHPHQPLWQQFYQSLVQKIEQYQETLRSNSDQAAKQEWAEIKHDFYLLWPGLVLGKSNMTVEKVDSLLKQIEKTSNLQEKRELVNLLLQMIRPLFFGSEKDVIAIVNPVQAISLQLMVTVLSCFILLILSYVSWKRYKQSQHQVYGTINR